MRIQFLSLLAADSAVSCLKWVESVLAHVSSIAAETLNALFGFSLSQGLACPNCRPLTHFSRASPLYPWIRAMSQHSVGNTTVPLPCYLTVLCSTALHVRTFIFPQISIVGHVPRFMRSCFGVHIREEQSYKQQKKRCPPLATFPSPNLSKFCQLTGDGLVSLSPIRAPTSCPSCSGSLMMPLAASAPLALVSQLYELSSDALDSFSSPRPCVPVVWVGQWCPWKLLRPRPVVLVVWVGQWCLDNFSTRPGVLVVWVIQWCPWQLLHSPWRSSCMSYIQWCPWQLLLPSPLCPSCMSCPVMPLKASPPLALSS